MRLPRTTYGRTGSIVLPCWTAVARARSAQVHYQGPHAGHGEMELGIQALSAGLYLTRLAGPGWCQSLKMFIL